MLTPIGRWRLGRLYFEASMGKKEKNKTKKPPSQPMVEQGGINCHYSYQGSTNTRIIVQAGPHIK
jgi:hypothetical protein